MWATATAPCCIIRLTILTTMPFRWAPPTGCGSPSARWPGRAFEIRPRSLPDSCLRSRQQRLRGALEHDPEKWKPVFRKDHAQNKKLERDGDPTITHPALALRSLSDQ